MADAFNGVCAFGPVFVGKTPENASAKADPTGTFSEQVLRRIDLGFLIAPRADYAPGPQAVSSSLRPTRDRRFAGHRVGVAASRRGSPLRQFHRPGQIPRHRRPG